MELKLSFASNSPFFFIYIFGVMKIFAIGMNYTEHNKIAAWYVI